MHSNAKFYLKFCIFFHISDHFLIANSKHQNVQIHQQTSTMLMIQTTKNRLVPILVGQAVLQTIGMSDYSLLHNITQTILLMPLLKELFLSLNQFITNNLCKKIWQFDPKVSRDKSCGQLFCLLISVRLWNFKDGGSLKTSFLAKNQHATKEKSLKDSYE